MLPLSPLGALCHARAQEGSEFVVLPALVSSGAACLIDELYLECHTGDSGDIGKGRSYDDCVTMLAAMRGMGVASHLWF